MHMMPSQDSFESSIQQIGNEISPIKRARLGNGQAMVSPASRDSIGRTMGLLDKSKPMASTVIHGVALHSPPNSNGESLNSPSAASTHLRVVVKQKNNYTKDIGLPTFYSPRDNSNYINEGRTYEAPADLKNRDLNV